MILWVTYYTVPEDIYGKNTTFRVIVMVILLHHSLVRVNCIIFSYIDKKKN